MAPSISRYSSLEAALHHTGCRALFLDAYGVFWAGGAAGAFPGAQETMERLFASGMPIGIVSNSTQPGKNEVSKYAKHGFIQGKHYHFLVTSGDVAKSLFSSDALPFPTPHKKYALFCPPHPKFSSPACLFEGSPFTETADLAEADFIYLNIPHIDGEDQEEADCFRALVASFIPSQKPMVCANPDLSAHEGKPPRLVVRQGTIASLYKEMGGSVCYIGKPSTQMFSFAFEHMKLLFSVPKELILMVGDTPETDIRGARAFGIHSALITNTGIMADRISKSGHTALEALPPTDLPDLFIERFATYDISTSPSP